MFAGLMGVMLVAAVPAGAALAARPQDQVPCSPQAKGDNVHTSSGDASGHGWWLEGTCSEPYGTVDVQLWEKVGSTWEEKANSEGSIPSGGGSPARVTARAVCASDESTYWRSAVAVVVSGLEYGSDDTATPAVEIPCRL